MEGKMLRRTFLQKSAIALGGVAVCDLDSIAGATTSQSISQVFFTRDISVNGLLKIYSKINGGMTGKIGIKLHTGEPHGPNLLPIELIQGLQPHIPNSTIVECNVLYPSPRQQTATHRETLKTNGFSFCPVDITAMRCFRFRACASILTRPRLPRILTPPESISRRLP
jgi:hypothetical protein